MSIDKGANNDSRGNREARNVRYLYMPYLLNNQLKPDIQDQNICRGFQDGFALDGIAEHAGRESHREDTDGHTKHHNQAKDLTE